jgi:hypothetical protein
LTFTPTATPKSVASVPGKITGGGNIGSSKDKATFGFVVQYHSGYTNPTGNLTYIDHIAKLQLKATSFTLLYIDGYHARFSGYAMVNGKPNVPFTVEVYDVNRGDSSDIFLIQIPSFNGYSAGGDLKGGSIHISRTESVSKIK